MNTPKPHWEVKLSSLHAVILVGLITGSMVAAFYLGFLSGERTGFESGQEASVAHTARVPIPDRETDATGIDSSTGTSGIDGAVAEEVYDQLAAAPKVGGSHVTEDELPTLGKIESAPARHIAERIDSELQANQPFASDAAGLPVAPRSSEDSVDSLKADSPKAVANGKTGAENTLGAMDEPRLAPQDNGGDDPDSENRQPIAADKATIRNLPSAEIPRAEKDKQKIEVRPTAIPTAKPTPRPVATPTAVVAAKIRSADSGMIRAILPKGWYAQVAAPRKISEAEALAVKLKRSGFPVLIERANVRGEEYFRVVVGPESDRVQVDRLISQVKREGYEPFPRAVK